MRIRDRRQRRNGERATSPRRSSQMYYYVTCVFEGRRQLVGPKNTEWEAQQLGAERFPVDFQVVAFDTIDLDEASRRLKGRLIDRQGLSEAIKRLGHKA